jgi:putative ABC transport system permease protein
MGWFEGARARLRLLFLRRAAESRMDDEFRFHLEMEADRLVREQGLTPDEARRRARVAFGGVEHHKEALRDDRGAAWLAGMSLDLKLGLRMLRKYPGLAFVGVIGMAIAVAIGAVSFSMIYTIVDGTLPLDDGDRVVFIRNLNVQPGGDDRRTHLHDLPVWREGLPAVEHIGAFRTLDRNLITPNGRPEPVRVAEMSASGFRITRVPPLLGRYFNDDDEKPGAPAVVIIGHSVWQNRFGGRPDIIGETLRLGDTPHAVIGVMPEGFAFPINNRVWMPLRLDPTRYERGEAPPIDVFGRLAPSATLADAQTQLATIARRLATTYPATHKNVRTRISPYAQSFVDNPELAWAFHLIQLSISTILVVIGTNVAILVYARTATRAGEIALRTALGASRRRIIGQLFAEALVLSSIASAVGVLVASFVLRQINLLKASIAGEQIPFWMNFGISPGVIAYAAGLAIVGAVIVGVVPALKVTGRRVQANLQRLASHGSAIRLGKMWTVLIVAQVAIAVAILPTTLRGFEQWLGYAFGTRAFPAEEFMSAPLELDRDGVGTDDFTPTDQAHRTRFALLQDELVRRLRAESGIVGVVATNAVPGDEPQVQFDVATDSRVPNADSLTTLSTAPFSGLSKVALEFFDTFDIPNLAGRRFQSADLSATANAIVVNHSFVQRILGGGAVLGRRVRTITRDRESPDGVRRSGWYEIVGVVPDFPSPPDPSSLRPRAYRPMIPGEAPSVTLVIRTRGPIAATLVERLRHVTVAVSPMLRLGDLQRLDQTLNTTLDRSLFYTVALVTLSVVLLSAAGIYALMSLTVTRRRREIGIRTALGATSRQVVGSILARATAQIAIGIAIGMGLAALINVGAKDAMLDGRGMLIIPGVAALMAAVGFAAAVGPMRRALRTHPTEALRSD